VCQTKSVHGHASIVADWLKQSTALTDLNTRWPCLLPRHAPQGAAAAASGLPARLYSRCVRALDSRVQCQDKVTCALVHLSPEAPLQPCMSVALVRRAPDEVTPWLLMRRCTLAQMARRASSSRSATSSNLRMTRSLRWSLSARRLTQVIAGAQRGLGGMHTRNIKEYTVRRLRARHRLE
jgi:hypothetical protein